MEEELRLLVYPDAGERCGNGLRAYGILSSASSSLRPAEFSRVSSAAILRFFARIRGAPRRQKHVVRRTGNFGARPTHNPAAINPSATPAHTLPKQKYRNTGYCLLFRRLPIACVHMLIGILRNWDIEVLTDLSRKNIVDFAMPGEGRACLPSGIAPPRVVSALTNENTPMGVEVLGEIGPLHVRGSR